MTAACVACLVPRMAESILLPPAFPKHRYAGSYQYNRLSDEFRASFPHRGHIQLSEPYTLDILSPSVGMFPISQITCILASVNFRASKSPDVNTMRLLALKLLYLQGNGGAVEKTIFFAAGNSTKCDWFIQ